MHVIATAGHVDHGKSTLLRALTGMEPDRWAEERRRGMTIDLGFAWTTLRHNARGDAQLAFVDVPGHERFIRNMLAGVGAVPSVLLVVAADGGWMPQTQEHVEVLTALGVRSAVVAVTRSDLADPGPVVADVGSRLADSPLADAPVVAVSATSGAGLETLQEALGALVRSLPPPRTDGPVRLWVDRSFTISGSGTVVTGTLGAGTLHAGDELVLAPSGRRVHVRALQSLGSPAETVAAVARVAVNLRGIDSVEVVRGDALLTPGSLRTTTEVDVVLAPDVSLPSQVTVHIGSAAVGCRVRPLGAGAARLRLDRAVPLQAGDRLLLRDPGVRQVFSADVRDPAPAPLSRRGAAADRALALQSLEGAGELRRRGIVRRVELEGLGLRTDTEPLVGDWLVDPDRAAELRVALTDLVARHAAERPLEPGVPVDAAVRELGLPDRRLVAALAPSTLAVRQGLLTMSHRASALPEPVASAVGELLSRLTAAPFAAPEAADLATLGLGPRELAAAERAQLLVRLTGTVVLAADAPERAAAVLAGLEQPFGVSEARRALVTTRRVAVPLLELLDRRGATRRLPDDRRVVVRDRA